MAHFVVKKADWCFYKSSNGGVYHKTDGTLESAAIIAQGQGHQVPYNERYVSCNSTGLELDGHFTLIPPEGAKLCKKCFGHNLQERTWKPDVTGDRHNREFVGEGFIWLGGDRAARSGSVDDPGIFSFCPIIVEVSEDVDN